MFELSPCLDSLFPTHSDAAALRTLAELGFTRFEFWDWRTHDLKALSAARVEFGLRPVVFGGNTFTEPLLAEQTRPAALAQLRRSFGVAKRLGVGALVVHVGYAGDHSREQQWQAAVDSLRAAGRMAAEAEIVLLVEPLNSAIDHPGYFLDSLPAARRLLEDVDLPGVRLLLDIYHMWLMHADLLALLPQTLPIVGHIHVADVPGRHEPGTGTIPWPAVVRLLGESGYSGSIGVECWASGTVTEALAATSRIFH
ncbi:MAG TPA: TIM barrel protein [bacterium]